MQLESRIVKKSRRRQEGRGWKLLVSRLRQHQVYLLIALGLCTMVAAGFVLARARPVAAENWRTEVINAAHRVVRNAVREDLRTSFASADETQIEELPGGKYVLDGWVDLVSARGQIDRQHFSCTLHRNQDEWLVDDVSVTPQ